jgi:hypothetical protein
LNGGDGLFVNSSLYILESSGCILFGITRDRIFSFFVLAHSDVKKENDDSNYKLSFTTTLFVPCGLNFTLRNMSNIEGKTPSQPHYNFTSFTNETKKEGKIVKSMIDSPTWDSEVPMFVKLPLLSKKPNILQFSFCSEKLRKPTPFNNPIALIMDFLREEGLPISSSDYSPCDRWSCGCWIGDWIESCLLLL